MRSDQPARSTVLVWDAPTRLFHWTLVLLVALAWVTGEAEGSLFTVHELAGYGVAVLLLFRVIWGFAGSRHSRFADFLRPWPAVRAHVSGMLRLRPARTLGHNPLGGWMALLLLVVLAESLLTRDNLVRAMITGRKEVSPGEAVGGHGAALAPAWLAALALGTASGIVWMLVA